MQDLVTGVAGVDGIALGTVPSENSSNSSKEIRYVPFKNKYVLMALMALLGGWVELACGDFNESALRQRRRLHLPVLRPLRCRSDRRR